MMRSIGKLLQLWWRQDRIRVSQDCGRLLSLCVGDRLLVDDQVLVVVKRATDEPSACEAIEAMPTHVEYLLRECSDNEGSMPIEDGTLWPEARLIVPIVARDTIRLDRGQNQRELLAEEVVALPQIRYKQGPLQL